MESANSFWMVVAIVFGIGAIVGAVVHRLFNSSRKNTAQLQQRLEQVEDELKTYKASVNSHFSKTSDLVSELTQDYVKVYKHLAEGAQNLGDPKEFTNVLEQQQGKVLISFADDVVPEVEEGAAVSTADAAPKEAEEVDNIKAVQPETAQDDTAITPESQEQLSETIKEVAAKVKGAESTIETKATATAGPVVDELSASTEKSTAEDESNNKEVEKASEQSRPKSEIKEPQTAGKTGTAQPQSQKT